MTRQLFVICNRELLSEGLQSVFLPPLLTFTPPMAIEKMTGSYEEMRFNDTILYKNPLTPSSHNPVRLPPCRGKKVSSDIF